MSFVDLILKIAPLYVLMGLGFFAARRTALDAADMGALNMQFLAPVVFFEALTRMPFSAANLLLPAICFATMALVCACVYAVCRATLGKAQKTYWLPAALATTNIGYYGIPVAVMVFGPDILGRYVLYAVGGTAFFYTVTQFMILRSHYNIRAALAKIVRLPVIHALLLGLAAQMAGFRFPPLMDEFFALVRGAYSVIGMMIIGIILGRQKKFMFDTRDIAAATMVRFILYPALAVSCVFLDRAAGPFLPADVHKIMLMVSVLPMGVDTATLAAQWKTAPDKIASLTLVNSVMALGVIAVALPYLLAL